MSSKVTTDKAFSRLYQIFFLKYQSTTGKNGSDFFFCFFSFFAGAGSGDCHLFQRYRKPPNEVKK